MARKSRKNLPAFDGLENQRMKVWQAALYIRLSVKFNSERGDSLETQRQIMEAYLALYPDIEIVGVYMDNGVTGRTFDCPEFQRMLDDIESGKVNCVVVKDLSRLGRNAIDTGYYIEKYFPLHQVRFIAVNNQYDSERDENGGSHIMVALMNMVNEAHVADISRKAKAQQLQSMKNGDFVGARPPYGYKKAPDNCHKLLINEDTAPVVQQIFQWAVDGVPLKKIVILLNESGIMTPGCYLAYIGLITSSHLVGSGKWQTWTVAKILSNEVYIGNMVQGKAKNIGHKQVPVPPEEWIVVRNTHEPLVSREMFDKAQEVRKQMAEKYTRTTKIPYTENILRGRLFCGHCGKTLHRQRNHSRYFYRCITNDRIGRGICKGGVLRLPKAELFATILAIIRQEAEVVAGNSLRLKQQNAKVAAQKAETEREIVRLQKETEANRSYLASLYQSLITGILTVEEYQEMNTSYNRKISDAMERVQQLQSRQKKLESQMGEYFSLADQLAAVSEDAALSAVLINQVIERVTVNAPDDISIQFRFESSFDCLMEMLDDE